MSDQKFVTLSSPAQLAGCPPLRVDYVDLPSWNMRVYVRELRADEADVWKHINNNIEAGEGFTKDNVIDLCFNAICTETGERVFKTPEDRASLAKREWTVLQAIFMKAIAVGRMSAEGVREEKKESTETPSSDSNSD